MKNQKPDARLVWKQLEEDLVPRLGLNLAERAVYACLLRHSRLEGKRQLRFGILWLARIVRVSDQPTRHAVRSLAAKGALRLVDRTQAGHLVEVLLPDEVHAAPPEGTVPSCLARAPRCSNIEEMDFLQVSQPARGHSCAGARPLLLLSAAVRRWRASPRPCRPRCPRGEQFLPQSCFLLRRVQLPEGRNGRRRFSAQPLSPAPPNLCRTRRPPACPGSARRR